MSQCLLLAGDPSSTGQQGTIIEAMRLKELGVSGQIPCVWHKDLQLVSSALVCHYFKEAVSNKLENSTVRQST